MSKITTIGIPTGGDKDYILKKKSATNYDVEWSAATPGGGGTGTVTSITAGTGLSGGTITASGTISHADTSSQTSVDNSNGTVIQDITLDTFGHVTALGSYNLDLRYYTETEIDSLLIGKQNTLTLTTTGTSGAATLIGSTLNIPNYSTGTSTGTNDLNKSNGSGGFSLSYITSPSNGNLTLGTSAISGDRIITTDGSTTNVNLYIRPKGYGAISMQTNFPSAGTYLTLSQTGAFSYAYDPNNNANQTGYQLVQNRFLIDKQTTNTNTVEYPLEISNTTNGTPSVGIGTGLRFLTQTTSSNYRYGSTIESVSTDTTNSSEDFDLVFKTMAGGATASEKIRLISTGQLKLNNYTSTSSFTGTAAGYLAFDSSGNIITTTAPSSGGITGSGTSGYVTYWNGASSVTGESNLFWDATNDRLGIGTPSPSSLLTLSAVNPTIGFVTTSTTTATMFQIIGASYVGTAPYNANKFVALNSSHIDLETGGAVRMRVLSGGDIGINTLNPVYKLDVNGSLAFRSTSYAYDTTLYAYNSSTGKYLGFTTDATGGLITMLDATLLRLQTNGGDVSIGGNITWGQTDRGIVWSMNTDGAYIKFFNTGDGDTNSRLEYSTSDNSNEYHRFLITGNERFTIKDDAVRFNNNVILHAANYTSYAVPYNITKDNITTRTDSGFYQTSAATTTNGWPTTTNTWYHLLSSTHSNDTNYYSLQIAAPFYSQNFYIRSTNGSGATSWSTLITSGNIGSQNVSGAANLNCNFLGNGSLNVSNGATAVYRSEIGASNGGVLNYAPVLHVAASDTMWQLQGSYGTGNGNIYFREGYSGSWGSWLYLVTQANIGSQSVSSAATVTVGTNSAMAWYPLIHSSGNSLYKTGATSNYPLVYAATGYIETSYINTTDDVSNNNISYVIAKFNDNYHRSASSDKVKSFVRLNDGTYYSSVLKTRASNNYESAVTFEIVHPNANEMHICYWNRTSSTGGYQIFYDYNTNYRGEIYWNGSNLIYSSASDYRLKTNIENYDYGLETILKMKPISFNFKDNVNADKIIGFLAHELEVVFPQAVVGKKDEVDSKGNPKYQSVDPAKIVPVLVAAIKEQQIQINTLNEELIMIKNK